MRLLHKLAVAALLLPSPALSDEVRYEAVWHSGSGASLATAPLSRSAFLETGEQLIGSGLRLFDVETREIDGERRYAGLWTQGTGSNIFAGPMSAINMREEMQARAAQGMRLVDFEIFRTQSGGRRYVGVWRSGPGSERLTGPMELDAFIARGENLVAQGLRLWDVETEVVNGTRLYHGLFRSGAGSNQFVGPQSRNAFRVTRNQMVANGMELRDIERITVNGNQRFISVWSSGDGESRFSLPRSFPDFFVFAQDQFNDGRRAFDLELRVIADEDDGGGGGGGGGGGAGPSPVNDLPPNPRYISFVSGDIFRIDWSVSIDGMPRIEIPIDYLPDYLPTRDGEPLLPTSGVCGFLLFDTDNAFWQVPGDPSFSQAPFNELPNMPQEDQLGGLDFWGPVLGCEGTQQQWHFPLPLTTHDTFNPQNVANLSLAIQFGVAPGQNGQGARIEFIPAFPEAEAADAHELWDDDWIDELIEWANHMLEAGTVSGEYCDVSSLIVELCEDNPGICPGPDPQGNC